MGIIPCDWQIRSLREVAQVQSGIAKNAKRQVHNAVDVHYLRVANVQDGYLDLDQMSTIRLSRDELVRYAVLPGDVLMNEGGDLDQLGRGAMWRGEFDPCVHQNHVFVVRCRSGLLPEFLNAWTASTPARRYFLLAGKQTTNLASINKKALGELPVPIPQPEEQRAIAEALADVDGLLGALDALIAKKRAIKQAAMQQLLTGKTRLPDRTGAWQTKCLGELVTFLSGGTPSRGVSAYWHGEIPWISATSLRTFYVWRSGNNLSKAGVAAGSRMAPVGSTLLLVRGSALHNEILAGLVTKPVCFNQDVKALVPNSSLVPEFLTFCLHGRADELLRLVSSAGNTAGVLDTKILKAFEILLPDKREQEAISAALADIDADIAAIEARREKTRAIKQGMMQQLLTGRVRLIQAKCSKGSESSAQTGQRAKGCAP